jgi:hypothetical protein
MLGVIGCQFREAEDFLGVGSLQSVQTYANDEISRKYA